MSDYLQAANYLHAGKDWAFDSSNHLKNITIDIPEENEKGFTHMVFSIPRKKMRSNAATFGDWQTQEEGSTESQKFRAAFCWFLEYVNRLSKSGARNADGTGTDKKLTKPDGDEVVIFFEIVKSDDGNIVGERIHVFNNRPETLKGNIIGSMLAGAKKSKMKKKLDAWDYHMKHVRTKEQIFLNVFNIYVNNTKASKKIYEANKLFHNSRDNTFDFYPEDIFSLKNFKIEGARERQNNWMNYVNISSADLLNQRVETYTPTKFKFPVERNVVKKFWMDIEPEYLWNKYLPSHQSKWVDLPEICVTPDEDVDRVNVYVKPCPAKCLIDDYLKDKTIQVENVYKCLTKDQLDEVMNIAKGRFIVHSMQNSANDFKPYSGWIIGSTMYGSELHHNHGNEGMEYTERLKSKFQNQHSISSFDIVEMETAYRLEVNSNRREVQETMVDKFLEQCVSGDSDISAAGKCIARWLQHMRPELYEKHGDFNFEIKDPSLSPFANLQFWLLQSFDSYMCVATAHSELLKLHYAAYDSYRQHGENQLHWNMIYTGESATSKSYAFDCKKQMSIEGTITEITYQTTRADAIDGDQNDHITIFNEAPPGLFQAGPGDQNQDALSMMKEKLTSNRVRTKTFERDEETGERKNRIAVSSQIGVYMGATNDNPALAEEAVKSRFHWGEFEKIYRKDKNISDYQKKAFDMEQKPELLKKLDQFLFYTKDQQMKVFYIWKFIFCKIINDIDLEASSIVLTELSRIMKRDYNIRIPPRTVERYRIMCRILTITNALDIVFNFKGGLHNGKPFELVQLLDVEPYLYSTEEISICAMNMVSVEISQLSSSRDKTLKALWTMFQHAPNYRKDKINDVDVIDYSYIRFNGGLKPLCTRVQHSIPFDVGKPSLHNIFSVLKMLGNEPFKGRNYLRLDEYQELNGYADNYEFSDQFPVPAQGTKKQLVAYVPGQNFHDLHMDLFVDVRTFEEDGRSVMQRCIQKLSNSKTKERRVIMGVPERKKGKIDYPQFMDIVELKCNPDRAPSRIKNSNQESSGVKDMMGFSSQDLGQHDGIVMDVDTDTWSWQSRCLRRLKMSPDNAIVYHPEYIKNTLKTSNRTLTFPGDLLDTQGNNGPEPILIKASEQYGINIEALIKKRKRQDSDIGNMII